MTRDELRVRLWERFSIVMPEAGDPVEQADAIMALVDVYSVGVALDAYRAGNAHGPVTEQDARDWLKARK